MNRTKLINIGMFYMLLGAFFFSLMNTSMKLLADSITINENIFFRGITMVFFIILLMFIKRSKRKKHHKNKKGGYGRLVFRALIGSLSLYAMLYNISTISLGTSVAFAQSAPIWTALFAWIILREKPNIGVIISVIVGFIGVILISNPETSNLKIINIILGILSGIFAALAFISIKSLKGYFDDLTIMLSFGLGASILGIIGMIILQDSFSVLGMKEYAYILLVGITGTIGQYYITRAYTFAPAGIVAPIDYTRIIFSLIFGIILGDMFPDIYSIIGMCLIILSGILVAMPIIIQEIKYTSRGRNDRNRML
ncbi:MAG: DMT family transporter [Helicobacteraceae bacterium]|nr:DMT family transporter [Helicobacteraceae bacterium]